MSDAPSALAGPDRPARRPGLVLAALLLAAIAGCVAVVAGASFDRAVQSFERGDHRAVIAQTQEEIAATTPRGCGSCSAGACTSSATSTGRAPSSSAPCG
jgi:hypothetical protein